MFKNRRHEAAVHLKEKPFGCELCPYRASRKQHIKVRFNLAVGLSEDLGSVMEKLDTEQGDALKLDFVDFINV